MNFQKDAWEMKKPLKAEVRDGVFAIRSQFNQIQFSEVWGRRGSGVLEERLQALCSMAHPLQPLHCVAASVCTTESYGYCECLDSNKISRLPLRGLYSELLGDLEILVPVECENR